MKNSATRLVIAIAALTALAACGSDGPDSSSTGPASSQASTLSTPTAMLAKFKAAGLPIGSSVKFTAATDPNDKLGRPNGYVAKSSWADKRIKRNDDAVKDNTRGSVDLGGSIEQFTNGDDAQDRADYIQSILKNAPVLGSEYDYIVGNLLIRVSGVLTPKRAAAYKTAATR